MAARTAVTQTPPQRDQFSHLITILSNANSLAAPKCSVQFASGGVFPRRARVLRCGADMRFFFMFKNATIIRRKSVLNIQPEVLLTESDTGGSSSNFFHALYSRSTNPSRESHLVCQGGEGGGTVCELHQFAFADKLRRLGQHKVEAFAVVPSKRAAFGGSNVGLRQQAYTDKQRAG